MPLILLTKWPHPQDSYPRPFVRILTATAEDPATTTDRASPSNLTALIMKSSAIYVLWISKYWTSSALHERIVIRISCETGLTGHRWVEVAWVPRQGLDLFPEKLKHGIWGGSMWRREAEAMSGDAVVDQKIVKFGTFWASDQCRCHSLDIWVVMVCFWGSCGFQTHFRKLVRVTFVFLIHQVPKSSAWEKKKEKWEEMGRIMRWAHFCDHARSWGS